MQVINLKSLTDSGLTGPRRIGDAVTVKDRILYFTKTFCVANKLKSGQRMHFMNEGPDWKFYVNDDPDGFELLDDSKKNGALMVCSAPLVYLIRKSLGTATGSTVTYEIAATKLTLAGCKLFMLMTQRPLKK